MKKRLKQTLAAVGVSALIAFGGGVMRRPPWARATTVILAIAVVLSTGTHAAAAADSASEDTVSSMVWTTDPSVIEPGMSAADASAAALEAAGVSMASVPAAPATWGGCGVTTDPLKIVRTFPLSKLLRCGNANYGYWHIYERHRANWESKAAGTYQNWRDVADIGMHAALSNSAKTTYRAANDTNCYSKRIYLVNVQTGQTVADTITRVVAGTRSNNVVTAFPSSGYCTGTE